MAHLAAVAGNRERAMSVFEHVVERDRVAGLTITTEVVGGYQAVLRRFSDY